MEIKEELSSLGWIEKAGWMVRFSNPRIGWKDGRLVIGFREHKEKVFDIETLNKIINQ